ncbi:chitinase-3-like protein 1 [Dermacentor andersoni]|uniref:chitinase-3-like protein 1 n=1 Tax=Dermacentor andersoni TaxID=34620 RepID=UPI0021553283|nr:probable chitinase 10 [Dermacentor andersoni]
MEAPAAVAGLPNHRVVQRLAPPPRPPPAPDEQADALTSTVCVALTLVVMFALMVTLQIYLVESSTIQDLLGFNMSFNPDTLFVSNATSQPRPPATANARTQRSKTTVPSPGRKTASSRHKGFGPRQLGDPPTRHPAEPHSPAAEEAPTTATPASYTLWPDVMYHRYRSVCMYKARRKTRSRAGRNFGIDVFPYHLCTDAVYCCAGINASDVTIKPGDATVDVFRHGWRKFSQLKSKNSFLRVWIAVGGRDGGEASEEDRGAYSKITREESLASLFVANAVDWLEAQSFDGLLLYWKFPEIHEMNGLIDLLRIMRASFRRLDHSVGVVVPLDHRLRERYDMRDLVDLMDDYSILVDPTEPVPPTYGKTALKWTQDVVERYAEAFRETQYTVRGHRRSGRFQLCYPLDVTSTSYTLFATDAEDNTTDEGVESSGPGQEGRSTRSPGRLAYDELCLRHRWDATQDRPYCRVALYGNQWISHPTPLSLEAFVRALMKVTGGTRCLGIWDPFWDDFAGHCGQGTYPLVQTIFNTERAIEKVTKHPRATNNTRRG